MARRLGVTRQDVLDAALQIADADGLDGVTVAAVAQAVGCRPPSVYHHVDGLDGLVAAVAEAGAVQLAERLTLAGRARSGLDALRSMSPIVHSWARSYPGRFDALARPVHATSPLTLAPARRSVLAPVMHALTEAGVEGRARAPWLAALVAAVRGAASVEAAGEPGLGSDRNGAHQLLVGLLLDRLAATVQLPDLAARSGT